MTKSEKLAYLAGFFDGEGCISIAKHNERTTTKGYEYRMHIQVCNVDPEPLKMFQEIWGGKLHLHKFKSSKPWRPSWIWNLWTRQALKFLEEIYAYLIVKRKEAEVAILFQKAKRIRGSPLTDAEWVLQEAQAILVSKLKRAPTKI